MSLYTGHDEASVPSHDNVKVAEIITIITERAKNSYASAQSIVEMRLGSQDARTVVAAGSMSALRKRIWDVRSNSYNSTSPGISSIDIPADKRLTHLGNQFY